MKKIYKRVVSLVVVSTMLATSPALAAYAENFTGSMTKFFGARNTTGPSAYLTSPSKLQVGDRVDLNLAGLNLRDSNINELSVTWHRVISSTDEIITGESSYSYTVTSEDLGSKVYATIEININNETKILKSEETALKVSEKVEEVENWLVSGIWEYDILDGTDDIQVRMRRKADDGSDFKGGTWTNPTVIDVPSTVAGHTVTKLADNAFTNCSEESSYGNVNSTIKLRKLPETLTAIGDNIDSGLIMSDTLIIPKSVDYIGDSFGRYSVFASNGGTGGSYAPLKKLRVENPTCYFKGMPVKTDSRVEASLVTYAGASGSSLENVYIRELIFWADAGLSTPEGAAYKWEQTGIYNGVSIITTPSEDLQGALDKNIKDFYPSADGKWQIDNIDGRNDVLIKPSEEVTNGLNISVPGIIDGKDVGALELDTSGKDDVFMEVPDNVIIDSGSTVNNDTIISGITGSPAEDFAKDKDLIFEAKDNEITTKVEFDNAKKSDWIKSTDGYWQYRFINGFAGVEIQNTKSFGADAEVEVPKTIDNHRISVFNGETPKVTYKSISVADCINVFSNFTNYTFASMEGTEYNKGTKNLTVYNKKADMTVFITKAAPVTITGWKGSTAEAICKPKENNIGSTFIPLNCELVGLNHIGGSWKTIKKATCTETGLKMQICSRCDADMESSTETIAATGHNYELIDDKEICTNILNKTPDFTNSTTNPWTQDAFGVWKSNVAGISRGKTELSFDFKLTSATDINFDWFCNAEGNESDYLYYTVYKDGIALADTGKNTKIYTRDDSSYLTMPSSDYPYSKVSKNLDAGDYKLTFTYIKDFNGDMGLDSGFVRNVSITGICGAEKVAKKAITGITLTGNAKVGQTFTAKVEPVVATVNIKWYQADAVDGTWSLITGADALTYTLTEADLSKFIKVVAEGTGEYEGTQEAITTTAVTDTSESTNITSVTISGKLKSGQELKANVYPAEVKAEITWLIADTADGSFTEAGTGVTYILTDAELGKYIKAEAVNTDDSSNIVSSNTAGPVKEAGSTDEGGGKITDSTEDVAYSKEDASNITGTEKRDVEVYAAKGQTITIKLPKRITLDGGKSDGTIDIKTEVKADISGADTIVVEPDVSSFELIDKSGTKKPLTATIVAGQTEFSVLQDTQAALETGVTATHGLAITKLSAGNWSGNFGWIIRFKSK